MSLVQNKSEICPTIIYLRDDIYDCSRRRIHQMTGILFWCEQEFIERCYGSHYTLSRE